MDEFKLLEMAVKLENDMEYRDRLLRRVAVIESRGRITVPAFSKKLGVALNTFYKLIRKQPLEVKALWRLEKNLRSLEHK